MKKCMSKVFALFLALILVVPMLLSTPAYAMLTSKTNQKVTTPDGKIVAYVDDHREIVVDGDNYYLEFTDSKGSVNIVQPNKCFYRVKQPNGTYNYYVYSIDNDTPGKTDTSLKSDDTTENGFVIGKGQISDQTNGKTVLAKFDHVLKKYTGAGGNVIIPEGVEVIASDVFNGRKDITSVTLPKSLVYLEGGFKDCTGLTTVSIPESVKYISVATFDGCSNLTSAIINGKTTLIMEGAFQYCSKNLVLYGLNGSTAQWDANYYGIKFKTLDQAPIAKGSLTVDTTSYSFSPKSSYVIGTGIDGYGGTAKASSNNSNTATVTKLGNGKFKVTGVNAGTTSIVFGVYNSGNKQIAHISVLVTVQNGIASNGNATKQTITF